MCLSPTNRCFYKFVPIICLPRHLYYHIYIYIHILSIVFYSSLSMLAGFLVPRWFPRRIAGPQGPSSSRDGCGPCCWLGRSAFGGSHGWNNLGWGAVCHSQKLDRTSFDMVIQCDSYNGYHWGHFVGSAIKGGLHAICNWLYIKKSDIVGWCLSTKWGIVINPFIGIYVPIKQMPSVE